MNTLLYLQMLNKQGMFETKTFYKILRKRIFMDVIKLFRIQCHSRLVVGRGMTRAYRHYTYMYYLFIDLGHVNTHE